MIRVAHLVISLENGGLENLVCRWTEMRNSRLSDSARVICLDQKGLLAERLKPETVHCANARRSKFPWDFDAVRRIVEICESEKIDLLHSHNLVAHQYGVLATTRSKIGHIQTVHGFNRHCNGWKERARMKLLGRLTPMMTGVSESVSEYIRKAYWVNPDRVKTIPNGVDLHKPSSSAEIDTIRSELGLPRESMILGSVGRLEAVKGWERFLPIFKSLVDEESKLYPGRTLQLVLVGDGSQHHELVNQVKQLGLTERVHFAGFHQDCSVFYDIFDVFIIPSFSEGLSVALLEAMAAGLPSISTNVGEHTDMITASKSGFLLDNENSSNWCSKIAKFLEQADELKICGHNAKRHVESHYTIASNLDQFEELYTGLSLRSGGSSAGRQTES